MRIAVLGGGASGMVTAYLLDKQGHHVTVFERQPILGGHIRTLNKNVKPNQSDCNEILENGVLEFPTVFHDFIALMQELEVELEPIQLGSAMFLNNGSRFLSGISINKNFTGIHRLAEHIRLDILYARAAGLWLRTWLANTPDLFNQPLSQYLNRSCIRNTWLKLLVMYSYSMPLEMIDNFPAELALPVLRDDVAVNWVRIKGGVYSYIEKILARFKGEVLLNVEIDRIFRGPDTVNVIRSTGEVQEFDKVVFATPPDQVMRLLADPSDAETKRFSAWQANYATTLLHTDMSMYARYSIQQPSEFDFFQTESRWGYNSCLNQICDISSPQHYFLAFQLEELIARDDETLLPENRIIHVEKHHTPLYTTEAFLHRDEIVATNGENNTYHAGAYLGDGLHGGAITSAFRVAELIESDSSLCDAAYHLVHS
jgi:predicted NAD/FAD-binding protein